MSLTDEALTALRRHEAETRDRAQLAALGAAPVARTAAPCDTSAREDSSMPDATPAVCPAHADLVGRLDRLQASSDAHHEDLVRILTAREQAQAAAVTAAATWRAGLLTLGGRLVDLAGQAIQPPVLMRLVLLLALLTGGPAGLLALGGGDLVERLLGVDVGATTAAVAIDEAGAP